MGTIKNQSSAKPKFNPDAAEEFITNLCIEVKNERNRIFQKDNENRKDKANPWYSDLYCRLLGEEMAYRRVLDYFAKFEL